jgi:trehalose monomycolate/heme transporter
MLAKMGRFLYHRRLSALGIILILVIGTAMYGLGLFPYLNSGNGGVENSESSKAAQLLQTHFPHTGTDVILLLKSDTLNVTNPAFTSAATDLLSTLKGRPEVDSLISYYSTHSPDFLSRDGQETFVLIQLKGQDFPSKQSEYTSLQPALSSSTLEVQVGGAIPAKVAIRQQGAEDLKQAESFTLPVLLVLMFLIFGGVIAALLPLLISGVAILGAFAVLRGLTTLTDVSPFAISIVTILGLGVTIDYALFMITRFREELSSNGQDVCAALEQTMATAGRTVIFSALTVITSFLSLLIFPVSLMRSLALGAISTVLVVLLVSLTLLPVLLALLGSRVNNLSLRRLIKSRRPLGTGPQARTGTQQGMWYRLAETVMRWPIPVTLVVLVILLTLGTPFLHIKLATTDINLLPPNQEARVVSERLGQDFEHQGNAQITIIVQTPGDALNPDSLASLDSYIKSIQALPGVVSVHSLVTLSPNLDLAAYQQLYTHPGLNPKITQAAASLANGDFSQVTVNMEPTDHSEAATNLVKQIRALHPSDLTALVDGITPEEIDFLAGIEGTLPVALLMIITSIFVLLFLMTGSLIMPLKAIILNILSLSATFGGLVWIFQDGHLQNLLHFELLGSIDASQPVPIFAFAFGLSMDYEVFVLSRIKESFDETGNNRQAVSLGIQRTGWLITSAALLLTVVLLGFAAATTISVQETGIGLALAVIVDAALIRTLLLPATMRLLGRFNWWAPAPLRRIWQYIGLKETVSTPALAPVLPVQASQETVSTPALAPVLPVQAGQDSNKKTIVIPARSPAWPVLAGQASKETIPIPALAPVLPVPTSKDQSGEPLLMPTEAVMDQSGEPLLMPIEVVMEPEILLQRYPNDDLVNDSLLQVASNQFCVLKSFGKIVKVYEMGSHCVQALNVPLWTSRQLGFDGKALSWEYEAFYINRARLVGSFKGVLLSREMAEVAYSVSYAFHIATQEDAARFVKRIPSRIQSLSTKDLNAYARREIEQVMNQLVEVIPIWQMQDLRKVFSRFVQGALWELLASNGITLAEVEVQVTPHEIDAVRRKKEIPPYATI